MQLNLNLGPLLLSSFLLEVNVASRSKCAAAGLQPPAAAQPAYNRRSTRHHRSGFEP